MQGAFATRARSSLKQRGMRSPILFLTFVAASLTAGCTINEHPAGLEDNVGTLSLDNSNVLHSPYVAGSRFTITVQAGSNTTFDGWTLTSSDPSVLQVGVPQSTSANQFPVQAGSAGHATLTVADKNGKVLDTSDVDVDVPTRIQLCEQGLLYAGYSDDQAALGAVQVVSGGTATFLARYFSNSQELYGNDALTAANTPLALASVASTSFSVRDFVEITGLSMGATTVKLTAGGADLDVPVTVIDPSAVRSMELVAQSESGASEGQAIFVFARARDAKGGDVYGASFAWTADGQSLPGNGNSNDPTDLLWYQYHAKSLETVTATVGTDSAATTVHGGPSTTYTGTSQNVGCSVAFGAGGAPASAAGASGFVLALALLASRRRTRGTSITSGEG